MMTTTDEFHLWIVASLRRVCRVFGSCRTSGATFSADQCAAADGSFMGHLSDKPVIQQLGSLIPCSKHLVRNNGTDLSECLALSLRKSFLHVDAISPSRSSLWPTLRERSFLVKMLSESRTVYQRLADGTARKRSVEDRSDEKNYAQRPHDRGKVMQPMVGRMLTVDEAKKTGRSDRADISRRTLQTRCSTDLGRRRLDVDRCLGSGGR